MRFFKHGNRHNELDHGNRYGHVKLKEGRKTQKFQTWSTGDLRNPAEVKSFVESMGDRMGGSFAFTEDFGFVTIARGTTPGNIPDEYVGSGLHVRQHYTKGKWQDFPKGKRNREQQRGYYRKHAHKDGSGQEKHGNRRGKRSDAEYKRLRRKFKTKEKSSGEEVEPDPEALKAHLRRAYRKFTPKKSDGVGTTKRRNNQRKYAQRYAAFRRGTRKTDPEASFLELLDAQDRKSVRIAVDAAFSRASKPRTMPARRDKIPNPESMSGTVGAEDYLNRRRRRVKPTGKVKRKKR